MKSKISSLLIAVSLVATTAVAATRAADNSQKQVKQIVDLAIEPVMKKYHIPGMAVGISFNGKNYVLNYGVASTVTGKPVTQNTLFEIGSVSKTFTATLASYAQVTGKLSLSDKTSKYLPELRGCKFGDVSLLNLGTHTTGGLPLQLPDNIQNTDQLMKYLRQWQPTYEPGTYRIYANPGVGLLGKITAITMKQPFEVLIETTLFAPLGMKQTHIDVPSNQIANYAQGYTESGAPTRMTKSLISSEAYGVKTTARDMIRYLEANMNMIKLDDQLERAIANTHTSYFKAGVMTQDLIWEQYAYPVELSTILQGNSPAMIYKPTLVSEIKPPQKSEGDVLINKTGSTNGFATYAVFVPQRKLGVIILANKSYPIKDRVTAAHSILMQLGYP